MACSFYFYLLPLFGPSLHLYRALYENIPTVKRDHEAPCDIVCQDSRQRFVLCNVQTAGGQISHVTPPL